MSTANGFGDVLTSWQAAKICKVAPKTLNKWVDAGHLAGYRIPKSQYRRIPRENLIRFLEEHGMSVPLELNDEWRVLLVGLGADLAKKLTKLLSATDECQVEAVGQLFEAGMAVHSFRPGAVVVDLSLGRSVMVEMLKRIRHREGPPAQTQRRDGRTRSSIRNLRPAPSRMRVVALAGEDETDADGLRAAGFDAVFVAPYDPAAIGAAITGA